jgi:tyrosinase
MVRSATAAGLAALPALVAAGVRRDYNTLTQFERDEYARGLNILKESGEYDDLVLTHLTSCEFATPWHALSEEPDSDFRNGESRGPSFFPWHREYGLMFETKMQAALGDNTWALPYWNYVNDASPDVDPFANPLWSASGVGSNGRERDSVVVDGPHARWPIQHTRNNETELSRILGTNAERPSLPEELEDLYAQTTYDCLPYGGTSECGFRNFGAGSYSARGNVATGGPSLHLAAHNFVGASFQGCASPNDPVFWLQHAFTDGMWYQWQIAQLARNPGTTHADWYEPQTNGPLGHNLDDVLIGLSRSPRAVVDHADLPYTYDDIFPAPVHLRLCFSPCEKLFCVVDGETKLVSAVKPGAARDTIKNQTIVF